MWFRRQSSHDWRWIFRFHTQQQSFCHYITYDAEQKFSQEYSSIFEQLSGICYRENLICRVNLEAATSCSARRWLACYVVTFSFNITWHTNSLRAWLDAAPSRLILQTKSLTSVTGYWNIIILKKDGLYAYSWTLTCIYKRHLEQAKFIKWN
jgi:hypothetical protein